MKSIFYKLCYGLIFLLSSNLAHGHCEFASATIISANDLGDNIYEWVLEWCVTTDPELLGETGATRLAIVNATFDCYQPSYVSPENGNAFSAEDLATNGNEQSILYTNPFGELYGEIDGGGAPESSMCNTIWFKTVGIPTEIQLWGMESDDLVTAGCFLGRFDIQVPEPVAPLPISLHRFMGQSFDDYNQLSWGTEMELNIEKFILQKTTENFEEWVSIETIEPRGSGSNYEVRDKNPNLKNYYRLKIFEFAGTYSYSDVIFLAHKQNNFSVESVFPNPVKDELNIRYRIANEPTHLKIADAFGKVMLEMDLVENTESISLSTVEYNVGVYFIILTSASSNQIKRNFVKIVSY